jgi:hypothetical protein
MTQRRRLPTSLRPILSLAFVGGFSAIAFGQAVQTGSNLRDATPFELIGWIALTGAGVTHIATNVYNLVRGKNYEQLKEAVGNYKDLSESRGARIIELEAKVKRLEIEAENAIELALRSGGMKRGDG